MVPEKLRFLFIINPRSGRSSKPDLKGTIQEYFSKLPHTLHFFELTGGDDSQDIKACIESEKPDRIVAAGGDGTVALVGKLLINQSIPMGILPAGSANGMAKELEIPEDIDAALDIITGGKIQSCDAIRINGKEYVFHLADVGLNALIIKYFDESRFRGMFTYARMLVKALFNQRLIRVHLQGPDVDETISAYMVVIANASKYGTGAVINPGAQTHDGIFELVIVRKIAFSEFIKLFISYKSFDPKYVRIIETKKVTLSSSSNMRFQIDGEYQGKVKKIDAEIVPGAIRVLVPQSEPNQNPKD